MSRVIFSLLILVFCGCGSSSRLLDLSTASDGSISGFYEGVLPCPDCEKMRFRLALDSTGFFVSEQTYYETTGETSSYYKIGAWQKEKNKILLTSNEHFYKYIGFLANDKILLLDDLGKEPEQPSSATLPETSLPELYDRTFPVEGFLSFDNSGALLKECNTRKTFRLDLGDQSSDFVKEKYSELTSQGSSNEVFSSLIVEFSNEHEHLTIVDVMTLDSMGSCDD